MKFKVERASDWDYEKEVEINTIEDLIQFSKDCEKNIVLMGASKDMPILLIYDDYIE